MREDLRSCSERLRDKAEKLRKVAETLNAKEAQKVVSILTGIPEELIQEAAQEPGHVAEKIASGG